ncbi:MAG: hypothetical protein ACQEXX_20060 [Bacillota bacterium]
MKFRSVLVAISITSLLAGCGSSAEKEELASTKESLEGLKAENESLKKELDDLKYGPENLLAEANSHFSSGDIKKLNKTKETMSKKHPGSEEEKKVVALAEKLQKQIDDKAAKEKAAAEKLAAAEKERQKAATAQMRTRSDEVTGYTVYEDKTSPKYINQNGFLAYFAMDDNKVPVLYARFQYTGDNWLFIKNYTIKADDQTFTINPNYSEVRRDNQVGSVWEYHNVVVTKDTYEMINAIINSKKTVIRSQGDERKQDRTVTDQEKKALQNVLDAFKAMGGTDVQFKL